MGQISAGFCPYCVTGGAKKRRFSSRPFTGRGLFYYKEEAIVYQKVDTNLNFVDREKKVEQFWKENKIFEKSMDSRK